MPALRGGLQVLPAQDIAHGQLVDTMAQVRQGALDPSIAPARILCCHAHDELLHLLFDTRTSELAALLTAVELLGDQPLVPVQEGIWRGDGRHLFEALTTKRVGQRRKPPAFGVGEPPPAATALGFENAIFFLQVGNHLLLVPLDPASDPRDEDMENHSPSSGWRP
jgi:hypothetical protein